MVNSRIVSLFFILKSVLVLVVLIPQIFKRLHVLNLVENLSKVLHHISAEDFDIFELDELKQLKNGWFEEIVTTVVADEGFDNGREEISLDDVTEDDKVIKVDKEMFVENSPIIEIILHRDDLAQESQSAKNQKSVRRSHEDEDSPQEILADDAVLDVIAVMFDAEREKFQDEPQKLNGVIVFVCGLVCDCVHQKWS